MAYTDIDKPSDYFISHIWSGTSSNHTESIGMQPDFVWVKGRSVATDHTLFDVVRGFTVGKSLGSNTSAAEDGSNTTAYGGIGGVTSDGFTVTAGSSNADYVNTSGRTYASWNWKAGTSFSNSAGANSATIASTGSVNTDAGFSIISYTGNGNDDDTAKIAHGLGVALNMIIVKCRNAAGGWQTSSTSLGFNNVLQLNETNAQASGTYAFGRTGVAPTSTVFTVSATSGGNHTNTNNNTYIAYCFAEKQGYSKFGSYTGNGNADGTFVYLGFKPAFFLVKRTDSTPSWTLLDNKRDPFNVTTERLFPNENVAGSVGVNANTDFLSNGVKIRVNHNNFNTSGGNYIYMAFAENPFTTSTGVPATAR